MANVVVCSDGTWNTPGERKGEDPTPTNVVKLYNALAERDGERVDQCKYYHPGVGTEGGLWSRLAGGGLGRGLDRNIMSAYRWLGDKYRPGDRIFLFGFSRGAYTARSLAGMISKCGLLDLSDSGDKDPWPLVEAAFACYRSEKGELKPLDGLVFHNAEGINDARGSTTIFFLGVWDTVGALGVPDDLALLSFIDDPRRHRFHDTRLGTTVENARHALAMDEKRGSFTPTLWTNTADRKEVKQVWFPGVHSDVGGGYARIGLSDGALKWMIEESSALGLAFKPGSIEQIQADPRGVRHDSRTGLFKSFKTLPRSVPRLGEGDDFQTAALSRNCNPPITEEEYWPTIFLHKEEKPDSGGTGKLLTIYANPRWNDTWVFLEAGVTYHFTATGEWLNGSTKCGPGGTGGPGILLFLVDKVLGWFEGIYRRRSGYSQADFWWTRREQRMPWFALVGVIASGGFDGEGNLHPHETFLIGNGCALTPKKSGYLYCFANDTWQTYRANRGSVRLAVRRD
jgi:uncharacterized protein (DUF2235 family)